MPILHRNNDELSKIINRCFKNSYSQLINLYEKIKKGIEIKNLYFLTLILTVLEEALYKALPAKLTFAL